MYFEMPQYFLLFLLFPLYLYLRKIKILLPLSVPLTVFDWDEAHNAPVNNKHTAQSFALRCIIFLRFVANMLCVLSFIFLILALTHPYIETEKKVYTGRGSAIIFVLDVSPSMAASDIENGKIVQTRFDAARNAIKSIVNANPGNSYGLALLAGEAALAVSATEDSTFFLQMLDDVYLGELGDSSAIGEGISLAVFHLAKLNAPKKCIVLLTDGENNSGAIHPNTAALLATQHGIIMYILGIGKSGSAAIEYTDSKTGKTVSGFLDSQFNEKFLIELAENANGEYFSVHSIESLNESIKTISYNTTALSQSHYIKRTAVPLAHYFVLGAISCIILGWFIRRIVLCESL